MSEAHRIDVISSLSVMATFNVSVSDCYLPATYALQILGARMLKSPHERERIWIRHIANRTTYSYQVDYGDSVEGLTTWIKDAIHSGNQKKHKPDTSMLFDDNEKLYEEEHYV